MWVWMSTFQTQNPYNCDSREHALSFLLFNENLRWCATHRKQLPTRSKDNLNDKWVYYREDHLPRLAASSLISTSVTKFVFTGWQMKSKTFIKRKMLRICCISVQLQQYNISQCHKPKLMAQHNLICTKLLMKVTQTEQITLCCYKKTKISPKWTDAIKQLKNVGYSMNIMMISWLNGAMLLIFYRFPIKGDCLEAEAL